MLYDAVIVGAGPAGASCAAMLSKKGSKVLIIDRSIFPREKACGGLISRKTIDFLTKEFDLQIDSNKIFKINLRFSDDYYSSYKSDSPLAIVVRRRDFDNHLVELAQNFGATFIHNCNYINHEEQKQFCKVYTSKGSVYTRYLIGADGCFSSVAKKAFLRKKWSQWELGIAMSLLVPEEYIPSRDCEAVDFFFFKVLGGLGWCFPGKGFFNLGVGGWYLDSKNVIANFYSFMKSAINSEHKIEQFKINSAFLPAGGRARRIAKERVILIGDAAGLVDGFSGEGIFYAVQSAKIASETILNYLPGQVYQQNCYKHMIGEFRLSALVSILLGNRQIDKRLYRQLCEGFCDILTGCEQSSYKKLLYGIILKTVSLKNPFLWAKRLFFD